MSLHDAYARLTPFEIAFPDDAIADQLVEEVDEEAAALGVDAQLLGVFTALRSVADASRGLLAPDAPAGAAEELGWLLFQVVHFSRAGRKVYLLETAAARYLVEGAPGGAPRPPESAGYLQLPQHLFWMGSGGEGVPESIDGIFWFASDAGDLHALPVTGVLPDSLALRALPLPMAPLEEADSWLEAAMREDEQDFASSLPGQELDGLYSVETAGEVLKLLARFFAYVDRVPHAVRGRPGDDAAGRGGGAPETSVSPRPSRLPFSTVALVG